jgi:hypothetical protein
MADKSITFGAGTAGFGALTGWALQEPSGNLQKDRANALDASGNEAASALYNTRTDYSSNYVAVTDSAAIPLAVGAVINAIVCTQIELGTTGEGFKTMTLTGHQHANNAHTTGMATFTHGITIGTAFGAQSFIGGADSTNNAAVQSSSLTIACDHVDINAAAGEHLAGQSHNGRVEGSTTWAGTLTSNADSGWDVTGAESKQSNTGFLETTISATKPLTLDT